MKLGVVADVHGNLLALQAVVADAAQLGVDRWWALGDLVLFGPRPAEVLDLLLGLPQIAFVRGNTDRYVITGEQPRPHATAKDAAGDSALVERYGLMAGGIGWTRGALAQAGSLDLLPDLPAEQRLDLPDGTRLLGVHASPRSDDGPGIDTDTPADALADLVAGCHAEVIMGGHTHVPTNRVVAGVRALNGGSVGLPRRRSGACWLMVEADDTGVDFEFRVAEFDIEAVCVDLHQRLHPNADFVAAILRRQHPYAH